MAPKNKFKELHLIKFDLFKSQDPEIGRFDVIFEVEEKLLYAHKTMLTLVSNTFDSMLSERWMKNKDEPIKIESYGYDNFYQLITFLYSGQCSLTDTNISSMVDIAEFYGIELFKEYCDEYLAAVEITAENAFTMIELADKYSMAQLKFSAHTYICDNFQSALNSDDFMKLSKSFMEELVYGIKEKVKPDDLFLFVYKWSEKHAMVKKAADPTLNLNDSVKDEISVFLSSIKFCQMGLQFFSEFVVSRGFIFSSFNDLSQILSDRLSKPMVKVTNANGQTLHGNVISDKNVIENIKSLTYDSSAGPNWWCTKCKYIPSTPSPLKKREGVQWYLVLFLDGDIGVKKYSNVCNSNYLLAELTPGDSGFQIIPELSSCKIEIE